MFPAVVSFGCSGSGLLCLSCVWKGWDGQCAYWFVSGQRLWGVGCAEPCSKVCCVAPVGSLGPDWVTEASVFEALFLFFRWTPLAVVRKWHWMLWQVSWEPFSLPDHSVCEWATEKISLQPSRFFVVLLFSDVTGVMGYVGQCTKECLQNSLWSVNLKTLLRWQLDDKGDLWKWLISNG